jgi:hypothetical protein
VNEVTTVETIDIFARLEGDVVGRPSGRKVWEAREEINTHTIASQARNGGSLQVLANS